MYSRQAKAHSLLSRAARVLIAGAIFAGTAIASLAGDQLHLKDGRTLEGSIEKEVNGYVWFKSKIGGIEQTQMYRPEDIKQLERADASKPEAAKPEAATGKTDPKKPAPPAATGTPRAVVLTLGDRTEDKDMVGKYLCAKPLMDAIPKLEEEIGSDGSGVVVMRIDSGGGMLLEISKLHDVIEKEYKPRFRTVAWIKWAISAAAMTSHVVEEIYFYPEGNYGACTGWFGEGKAVSGRQLEDVLFQMEKASARGKKSKEIMRAMQVLDAPLSCTIDANGDVHWFQDESAGDLKINAKDQILTFTSQTAEQVKFSKGTTDNYSDLARLMGYQELHWVGQAERGTPWPVSQAELIQRRFRDKTFEDETATNAYLTEYQESIKIAQSQQNKVDRGKFVGKARTALGKIQAMMKNNPNFVILLLNQPPDRLKEWVDEQERMLRDLMK